MKKENVVVKNQVILNLIQDLQRLSLQLVNNRRGRCQIEFGMTSLFNNGGFTLIELLVVVLIIGILAAVAVPQYQKSVMKARATEAIGNLYELRKAQQIYFLANGKFTTNLSNLDLKFNNTLYSYACTSETSIDCYAMFTKGGPFFFEISEGYLWCRGTQQACAPFSQKRDTRFTSGEPYWIVGN